MNLLRIKKIKKEYNVYIETNLCIILTGALIYMNIYMNYLKEIKMEIQLL